MPKKLCPRCHGQRTISCLACHGTGKKTIVNISIGKCKECGGTRRRLCDVCSGAGEVEREPPKSAREESVQDRMLRNSILVF